MRRLPVAIAVSVALVASPWLAGAAAALLSQPAPPVGVSTDAYPEIDYPAGEHQAEVDIAIDPTDPNHLLIGGQEGRFFDGGAQATGTYVSFDGGATWTGALLPGASVATGGDLDRSTDPVVAFAADGTAYANVFSFDRPGLATAVLVYRSPDGGLSWDGPFEVVSTNSIKRSDDKNWFTIDTAPASPFFGRIYVTWTRFLGGTSGSFSGAPIMLSWSDDGGQTWSRPVKTARTRWSQGSQPLVGPDGTLYIVFQELFKEIVRVTASHDGGETFGKARVVAPSFPSALEGLRTGDGLPNADVDPVTGFLHVVWQDARFDVSDVLYTRSRDGRTWSAPLLVSDDDGDAQFTPAVAAYGGVVHVIFYDSRDPRDRDDLYSVRYARSTNGGRTFGANEVVRARFDMDLGMQTERGIFLGDYIGIDAVATAAHAAWIDTTEPSRHTSAAGQNDAVSARVA